MVSKGDKIKVVRGVKVPRGTTGTAFWVGETKYGLRVGFKADGSGETLWTAMGNVERVIEAPAFDDIDVALLKAVTADSGSAAYGALAARISALEARIEALEAAHAAADVHANAPALIEALAA